MFVRGKNSCPGRWRCGGLAQLFAINPEFTFTYNAKRNRQLRLTAWRSRSLSFGNDFSLVDNFVDNRLHALFLPDQNPCSDEFGESLAVSFWFGCD
jgi:hypothetical protein